MDEYPIVAHLVWRDGGSVDGQQQFAVWYGTKIREAKAAAWDEGRAAIREGDICGDPKCCPEISTNPYEEGA